MSIKFKIGDRVRVICKLRDSDIGWKGTVIENSIAPWVKMDNKPRYKYQEDDGSAPGWVVGHMDCMEQEALELVDPLEEAPAAADKGIASSAEYAEQDVPGWGDMALTMVRWFAKVKSRQWGGSDKPFNRSSMSSKEKWSTDEPGWTAEECRLWCSAHDLPEPTELRAWGSVIQHALREKLIVKTGEYRPTAASNGGLKALYRKA